jgi:hypothetical protein
VTRYEPPRLTGARLAHHLSMFLGCDDDTNAITRAVFALADRADGRTCSDCGHPLVEHDDRYAVASGAEPHGCRWCDNRRGGALCRCDRVFPDAQNRAPVAAAKWDAAVDTAEQNPDDRVVYAAFAQVRETGALGLLGIYSSRERASGRLGRLWCDDNGQDYANPQIATYSIDEDAEQ